MLEKMLSHTDHGDSMYIRRNSDEIRNQILKPRGHNALWVLPWLLPFLNSAT